jgi:hypothetical protein
MEKKIYEEEKKIDLEKSVENFIKEMYKKRLI